MRTLSLLAWWASLALPLAAQAPQLNTLDSALNLNDTAINAFFAQAVTPPPLTAALLTDSPFTLNLKANPSTPVLLLWSGSANGSSTSIAASTPFPGIQIDIADQGAPGYGDQILVDGYAAPWPTTYTDGNGDWSLCTLLPACTTTGGATTCITAPNFDVTVQAVVAAPNPPFNITTTGTVRGDFLNGYTPYSFQGPANDEFALHSFLNGFTFDFYGTNYSEVWISENGQVQFGTSAGLGAFANPSLALVNGSAPRIMSYFNDLDPDISGPSLSIFVRQSTSKAGLRQVQIVHRNVQEFMGATGPHGGTITLNETGEIAVLVDATNAPPSINTVVGISPGGAPLSSFPNPITGFDLSVLTGTFTPLGAGVPGFEVFDAGANPVTNPVDLAGFNQFNGSPFGPGVIFLPDPAFPNGGYIVQ